LQLPKNEMRLSPIPGVYLPGSGGRIPYALGVYW
jgi:hypothetical protein